jgi:2-methylisocitrate lyase-like PEP mutase family enzyme
VEKLQALGVAAILTPGSSSDAVVSTMRDVIAKYRAEA